METSNHTLLTARDRLVSLLHEHGSTFGKPLEPILDLPVSIESPVVLLGEVGVVFVDDSQRSFRYQLVKADDSPVSRSVLGTGSRIELQTNNSPSPAEQIYWVTASNWEVPPRRLLQQVSVISLEKIPEIYFDGKKGDAAQHIFVNPEDTPVVKVENVLEDSLYYLMNEQKSAISPTVSAGETEPIQLDLLPVSVSLHKIFLGLLRLLPNGAPWMFVAIPTHLRVTVSSTPLVPIRSIDEEKKESSPVDPVSALVVRGPSKPIQAGKKGMIRVLEPLPGFQYQLKLSQDGSDVGKVRILKSAQKELRLFTEPLDFNQHFTVVVTNLETKEQYELEPDIEVQVIASSDE